MIKVSYDAEHNCLIIEFKENIDTTQTAQFFSDVEKALPNPGKGFKLLTDFTSVQNMELAVKKEIIKAMAFSMDEVSLKSSESFLILIWNSDLTTCRVIIIRRIPKS
jgi:hypothetical protein